MLTFDRVLHPISKEIFYSEYYEKKIFVGKSDKRNFKDHYSWKEFDEYLQSVDLGGYDRCPQLTILFADGSRYKKKTANYNI